MLKPTTNPMTMTLFSDANNNNIQRVTNYWLAYLRSHIHSPLKLQSSVKSNKNWLRYDNISIRAHKLPLCPTTTTTTTVNPFYSPRSLLSSIMTKPKLPDSQQKISDLFSTKPKASSNKPPNGNPMDNQPPPAGNGDPMDNQSPPPPTL